MAHSNSSILEAWFAAVRNTKQDSATRYQHYVANKDMEKANADVAWGGNKMYSPGDVGELSTKQNITSVRVFVQLQCRYSCQLAFI
mmetsp:Transcript_20899/g.34171  ORF Transcript_20899/g.34171 Transcript_20899/m.34171 type:complete len:86 (+) Transcript_20899:239-496(+)